MAKIVKQLTELVGNTPMLEFSNFNKLYKAEATIIGKLEYFNPAGSVKDRFALAMDEDAEKKGLFTLGATITYPTSGHAGVVWAYRSSVRWYT